MKRSVFNIIKDNVHNSSAYSRIWWMDYIWRNLTDGQLRTLITELDKLSFIYRFSTETQLVYILPSGLDLRFEKE